MKSATTSLTAVLLVLVWGGLQEVQACSCAGPLPPNQALQEASSVFTGTVVSIDSVEFSFDTWTVLQHRVTLNVGQSWKGVDSTTVFVYTATNSAACGYYFEPGQEYLVYTYLWAELGEQSTGICTRTRHIQNAADDFTALGAGRIVSTETGTLPTFLSLDENYPNPFNPTTRITYKVAASTHIRLAVYDLLGREVQTLADGIQTAGTYHIDFDAQDLPSGTYIYTLVSGKQTLRRTMTLSK